MNRPLQVTFRHLPHTEALDAYVAKHAAKLDRFHDRITGCHVVVEAPHQHKKGGRHYDVRIDLTIPGAEIVINQAPDEDTANEDLYAAIDRAFAQLERRLEEHVRLHDDRHEARRLHERARNA